METKRGRSTVDAPLSALWWPPAFCRPVVTVRGDLPEACTVALSELGVKVADSYHGADDVLSDAGRLSP